MTVDTLAVIVLGRPVPQGSKRPIRTPAGVRLVESSNVKPYRQAVANAAHEAFEGLPAALRQQLHSCPLRVHVTFLLRRPAGHHRTGRHFPLLRPSAPARPGVAPDVSKLARAAEDALMAGGAIRDDAQIVDLIARKRYAEHGDPERTIIEIFPLAATVAENERAAIAA